MPLHHVKTNKEWDSQPQVKGNSIVIWVFRDDIISIWLPYNLQLVFKYDSHYLVIFWLKMVKKLI